MPSANGSRAENPNSNRGWGVAVERYADSIVGPQLRTSLLALTAAVFGLLLICCSNLASLVLVRAVTRKTEVAVRAALGASQRRLVQQLFIEHALLTAAGSLLGIALAYGGIAWLTRTVPPDSLPSEASVGLDARVVAVRVDGVGPDGDSVRAHARPPGQRPRPRRRHGQAWRDRECQRDAECSMPWSWVKSRWRSSCCVGPPSCSAASSG